MSHPSALYTCSLTPSRPAFPQPVSDQLAATALCPLLAFGLLRFKGLREAVAGSALWESKNINGFGVAVPEWRDCGKRLWTWQEVLLCGDGCGRDLGIEWNDGVVGMWYGTVLLIETLSTLKI
ncbi:hypothetical protein E2C01_038077 [Portunus trituberculatus]|uniref:Uncharacterized protein n=1 Tax=Portunus trituberculatus TaxID=210409 RepID=A0A5B7FIX8_PORTR|nr:hypothetical protein [Portunus trituberculatus]